MIKYWPSTCVYKVKCPCVQIHFPFGEQSTAVCRDLKNGFRQISIESPVEGVLVDLKVSVFDC